MEDVLWFDVVVLVNVLGSASASEEVKAVVVLKELIFVEISHVSLVSGTPRSCHHGIHDEIVEIMGRILMEGLRVRLIELELGRWVTGGLLVDEGLHHW